MGGGGVRAQYTPNPSLGYSPQYRIARQTFCCSFFIPEQRNLFLVFLESVQITIVKQKDIRQGENNCSVLLRNILVMLSIFFFFCSSICFSSLTNISPFRYPIFVGSGNHVLYLIILLTIVFFCYQHFSVVVCYPIFFGSGNQYCSVSYPYLMFLHKF